MSQDIKVSILMPVKNAKPFLRDCLDSIIKQSFTSWELLAVNDHSTDGSEDILFAYSKLDARVKVFQNEGHGIIPALRTAYRKAIGLFITRMDADDLMHENKLDWMHALLEEVGTGHLVVGLVSYISEKPMGEGYLKYESWLNQLSLEERNYEEIFKECVVPSPCWMLYKKDLESVGHFSYDTYPEDYDLCFRFRNANLKIKTVKEKIHFWRDHPNRSSRRDPNYADNRFIELKIWHFLKKDYKSDQVLSLWGAGKKGKLVAKLLKEKNIPFRWFTNNIRKVGHVIQDVQLEHEDILTSQINSQLIVAIAERGLKTEFLSKTGSKVLFEKHNVYFFC